MIMGWDFAVNILKVAGVPIMTHEAGAHPVGIGTVQIIAIIIVIMSSLIRMLNERRYC